MFRYSRTLQHPLGVPFPSFCDLIGHCPSSGRCGSNRSISPQRGHRSQAFYRWAGDIHRLDSRIQAIQLSPVVRVLRRSTLQRFQMVTALRACYGPFGLSTSGKHVDPGTSFQVPPVFNGDTTVRDMAHTLYARTPKHYSFVSVRIGCLPWGAATLRSHG
ncbi:MAG TPA: hypothetical protein VFN02_09410, partial [Ktedonobacteraceae bacterium]|nr:hypothetical protein [Ktedonobacteraceae bacterium]